MRLCLFATSIGIYRYRSTNLRTYSIMFNLLSAISRLNNRGSIDNGSAVRDRFTITHYSIWQHHDCSVLRRHDIDGYRFWWFTAAIISATDKLSLSPDTAAQYAVIYITPITIEHWYYLRQCHHISRHFIDRLFAAGSLHIIFHSRSVALLHSLTLIYSNWSYHGVWILPIYHLWRAFDILHFNIIIKKNYSGNSSWCGICLGGRVATATKVLPGQSIINHLSNWI